MGTGPRIPHSESSIRADERQRLSRDLHNSTSQLLVALQLEIVRLRREQLRNVEPILAEMDQIIQAIHKSIRQVQDVARDGHNCGDPSKEIMRMFYALGREAV